MKIDISVEKLVYLLDDVDYNICQLIYNILSDSPTDPHYSAVTASNLIKCYIQIMDELGGKTYNDIEEYFQMKLFTKEEYQLFEASRKKESEYYRGIQY